MTKTERITKVRLPFDRRHVEPKKNYGIGGLGIWFILKGPLGAVQFYVNFGVYLPHLYPEYKRKFPEGLEPRIEGFDVGYHSPKPMWEGQKSAECDVLECGKCYYDGSSLRADDWVKKIFSITGESPDEEMWKMLEQEYKTRFENEETA